ncbi:kynurenine 3-monooxygenase [Aspergillus homomorphus CBS 101889]|uniref:Kynurenine 3-monooxygenase n=1 Tax=Aspergillus homomorphus (strain CBS 101889) TaxID=1450537 RepID=A0A395HU86_ASPHC|nr:FAD/NAD(P)-binding domain-containing protein [Aspergillus homomorphus CBS 101889]RAL11360.1 FAD/NAD(P)-binding domain-containing protein [Aspergillus homomorphus CBS 101889]
MAHSTPAKQKVVIVGAGPVGSLAALYAAARGDEVEVYELRGDLRDPATIPLNFTKSINLALSERGITAMKQSNRDELTSRILADSIPMEGRMIHGRTDGKLWEAAQAYDVHGRAINAVDRGTLNNAFLDELEKIPNVKLFFNHKLVGAEFRSNRAWFERRDPGSSPYDKAAEVEVTFDLLIGADGAHSASRYHMMKYARVDYQQEYIDTLWCEFRIPPSPATNDFLISPNHLHIWPGKEFMFIAIPSADKSFTCTLFAPAYHYETLSTQPRQALLEFFDTNFPGVCPDLISPEALHEQFTNNQHLPLISIKCKPHHYDASVVIVGDAAHAVLPFYGQGLNAGLEDIRTLFDILDRHGVYDNAAGNHDGSADVGSQEQQRRREARGRALQAYTDQRAADTHAINDLSKQNFLEMRWGVKSPLYRLRKSVEETLVRYVPGLGWQTQYTRVSFSNQRYSEVVQAVRRQGQLLGLGLGAAALVVSLATGLLVFRRRATAPVWPWTVLRNVWREARRAWRGLL